MNTAKCILSEENNIKSNNTKQRKLKLVKPVNNINTNKRKPNQKKANKYVVKALKPGKNQKSSARLPLDEIQIRSYKMGINEGIESENEVQPVDINSLLENISEEDISELELQEIEEEENDEDIEVEYITNHSKEGSDDSIKFYLEEISRYKLLNQEEEYDLSKKIQAGNEKALEHLINANLRLVVKIAKNYISPDYPLIDVIQDGNLGLIHAAKKFDYRKNVRFSTYASWWIKQTIIRSLSVRRRMIRIPHRKEEKLRKIKKSWNAFYQANKKAPSREALADMLNIPENEIDDILTAAYPVVSYENTINEEDGCLIKNLISDDSYKPEDILIKDMLKNEAHRLLDTLYPKERIILLYRFGFKNGKKLTLKKMGKYFGISAETVRQIEIKALKKLRENFKYLEEYLN